MRSRKSGGGSTFLPGGSSNRWIAQATWAGPSPAPSFSTAGREPASALRVRRPYSALARCGMHARMLAATDPASASRPAGATMDALISQSPSVHDQARMRLPRGRALQETARKKFQTSLAIVRPSKGVAGNRGAFVIALPRSEGRGFRVPHMGIVPGPQALNVSTIPVAMSSFRPSSRKFGAALKSLLCRAPARFCANLGRDRRKRIAHVRRLIRQPYIGVILAEFSEGSI